MRLSPSFVWIASFALALGGCIQTGVGSLLPEDTGKSDGTGGGTSGSTSATSGATTGAATGSTSTSGGATSTSGSSSSGAPAKWKADTDNTSVTATLMDSTSVTIAVDPSGYTGSVALDVMGAPADVTAKLDAATLDLDGSTVATTKLTLSTLSSTVTGDMMITVHVASKSQSMDLPVSLTVKPELVIHIPQGVNGMSGPDSYGAHPFELSAQGITANNPITVKFMNDDNVAHQIHGESPQFKHDPGDIQPHSMDGYVRTPHDPGVYNFYLHDQGGAQNPGAIRIQ